MYAEIKDAIAHYNLLCLKFTAFTEQLQKLEGFAPPAVVWGKCDQAVLEFSFFDRPVRLHFEVIKHRASLLGRFTIARIQRTGEHMDLLRPVFFNTTGSVWLEKPESAELSMETDYEMIASYLLMPLLPTSSRNI